MTAMCNPKVSVVAVVVMIVLVVSLTAATRPISSQTPTPAPTPTPTPSPALQQSPVKSWFCRLLGIDPKIYDRLTRVRPDDTDTGAGERLMKLNLQTEQETELWRCGGCWSPVRVRETEIAVLKNDGLWLVPTPPAVPTLLVPQKGLTSIIGPLQDKPGHLLVIAETGNPQCRYAPRVADLSPAVDPKQGRLQDPPNSPFACFNNTQDVLIMLKTSRTRNNILLSDTRHKGTDLRLSLLTRASIEGEQSAPSQPVPLTPRLNELDDAVGRFSPSWFGDQEIIYVALP